MPGLGWLGALAGAVLWLFSPPGAAGQSSGAGSNPTPQLVPRTHAEREQRFLTEHRIILNVQVADAAGKAITGLQQGDFTLYDNDQPRTLAAFSMVHGDSPAPPHVILVLDAVNNYSKSVRSSEREVERFLKDGDGPLAYPVSIGVFAGASIDVGQASRDRDALLADLRSRAGDLHSTGCLTQQDQAEGMQNRNLGAGVGGGYRAETAQMLTCLNARFISSVMAVQRLAEAQVNIPGRVILIWIGAGWPELTNRSFAPDPPELKQRFFDQLVNLSMALREAQVTVDAVASPDELPYPAAPPDTSFFDGVTTPDGVKAGNLGLHALAHETGGHIMANGRDLAQQIEACMADVESYYVLSFDAPPAAGFGEYHSLAVKVDKPGLEVRTTTLYYGEQ
jgi:VWFA-related protein